MINARMAPNFSWFRAPLRIVGRLPVCPFAAWVCRSSVGKTKTKTGRMAGFCVPLGAWIRKRGREGGKKPSTILIMPLQMEYPYTYESPLALSPTPIIPLFLFFFFLLQARGDNILGSRLIRQRQRACKWLEGRGTLGFRIFHLRC